jgi:hypothetical protein
MLITDSDVQPSSQIHHVARLSPLGDRQQMPGHRAHDPLVLVGAGTDPYAALTSG